MIWRRAAVATLAVLVTLTGCSQQGATPPPATPSRTVAAPAPDAPSAGACHQLNYQQALAPTSTSKPVPCNKPHTAQTTFVGQAPTVVGGHLLAPDSARVRAAIATECGQRLPRFLGLPADQVPLTMLRSVWFTPTPAEIARGANWFRCEVIALAAEEKLAPLTGSLASTLADPDSASRFAMCGTASPDSADFRRVVCSTAHTWRAVEVVNLPDGRYPGRDRVAAAGQDQCDRAGQAAATDPLNYQWAYEWPTAEQWQEGQTYGRCWVPSS